MKKLLATGLLICMFAANAQELEKPKIIVEKIGNVTNYRAEGNLEPTQYLSCVGLDSLKNTYTPPDLYTGVAACVKQKDYERAIDLFKLAGAYSFYDAQRVSDKTAAPFSRFFVEAPNIKGRRIFISGISMYPITGLSSSMSTDERSSGCCS